VVLLLAAWRGLPNARWGHRRPNDTGCTTCCIGVWRLAREARFLCFVGILAMTTAAFYVFLGGAPVVLGSYGVGPADIGWYIMCVPFSYVAGNFLTSRLIHRQGERRMMLSRPVGDAGRHPAIAGAGRPEDAIGIRPAPDAAGHRPRLPDATDAGRHGRRGAGAGRRGSGRGWADATTDGSAGRLFGRPGQPREHGEPGPAVARLHLRAIVAQFLLHRR
jgi:hypothetical protein